MFQAIGFDGDDTLWHNETVFAMTQARFCALMTRHVPDADVGARLLEIERANLSVFGYGIKGFTLSMIETALAATDRRIPGEDIAAILDFARAMANHPVELIDGAAEVLGRLSGRYRLLLITKGDLFDQESKIARSGLAPYFDRIEIVAEKNPATYRRILAREGVAPAEFLMVGNALRSDVLPVLAIGGWAAHRPYHLTWAHEEAELDGIDLSRFSTLDTLASLPELLERWPATA